MRTKRLIMNYNLTIFCHSFGGLSVDKKPLYNNITTEKYGYYASRCFVISKRGDLVVLPPSETSLQSTQVLSILNEIGLGVRKEDVLFLEYGNEGVYDPNQDIKTLKKISGINIYTVNAFSGRAFLPNYISNVTNSSINYPHRRIVEIADDKVFFQTINSNYIPEGVVVENFETAEKVFSKLTEKSIIKTAKSASGLSLFLISPDDCFEMNEAVNCLKEGNILVLQKYYPHHLSPSVNLEIKENGKIIPLFISEQLLSTSSKGISVHKGNIYPVNLPLMIKKFLLKESVKIVKSISLLGYYGYIGVDWILSLNSKSGWYGKAVEVNARITAPIYPFLAIKKLGAKSFCIKNSCLPKKMTADEVRNKIDPIFWHPETKEGVIFYNFNLLTGKMIIAGFSNQREKSIELVDETEKCLNVW
jgi:predicted ATP-grasp superfamily ATP-dependent carboligase